ncbi:MAG: hypothetical protein Pars2KO_07370 [Parasphingorhabdus sp.]
MTEIVTAVWTAAIGTIAEMVIVIIVATIAENVELIGISVAGTAAGAMIAVITGEIIGRPTAITIDWDAITRPIVATAIVVGESVFS